MYTNGHAEVSANADVAAWVAERDACKCKYLGVELRLQFLLADARRVLKMTLRIDKRSDGQRTTIRLIGHLQAEHLAALQELINKSGTKIRLDLKELTLADRDAVRFLADCQAGGTTLVHCPSYIRIWMARAEVQYTKKTIAEHG